MYEIEVYIYDADMDDFLLLDVITTSDFGLCQIIVNAMEYKGFETITNRKDNS